MSRVFEKPATTFQQQMALLASEGMEIGDVQQAEHWLRHVSYYRLSAYWLPFEHPKGTAGPRFRMGSRLSTVIALYEFDRRLRLLVLAAIERIEVAVRGAWAYVVAQHGGPHGYLNAALYVDRRQFHENLARLVRDVGTSPETYIEHYRNSYDDPAMPPVWMVAEMMSFGQLSRWYSSLADRELRKRIAHPLGLHEIVLVPLLRHLSTVRNTAAHHGRLWNRGFLIRMKVPQKPVPLVESLEAPNAGPAQLYNTLVLIRYLLLQVDPSSPWPYELKALLATHPIGDLPAMGFPPDWVGRPMWT